MPNKVVTEKFLRQTIRSGIAITHWISQQVTDEEYEIASDAFDEMLDDEEYDELVSEEELAAEEEDAKKF